MPNETNWQDITRRLDITPATQTDACNHKTRARGRAISKIQSAFTIPSVTAVVPAVRGILYYQMNCTAESSFRITNIVDTRDNVAGPLPLFVICIRYRIGTTVTRYRLLPVNLSTIVNNFIEPRATLAVQAPFYAGERIQPNFVIEWWRSYEFGGVSVRSSTYNVTTNNLFIPTSADETTRAALSVETQVTRDELAVALPEAIPTTYGDISNWLTN